MAFSSTITDVYGPIGTLRFAYGTFTNGALDSGGDITTGLNKVFFFSVIPTSHISSTAPKYSESSGAVTLVCDNNLDGNWGAIGI